MEPVDQWQGQHTPCQGKGQANPPMEVSRQVAVVPEGYPQNGFVEGGGQIFHSGGGDCSQKEKGWRIFLGQTGKEKNESGPGSIDRTKRQNPQTFSVGASAGGVGIGHFQQKSQETV